MAENKFDKPYLSLWEILCLIAYGIPEETGGTQWREQQPPFKNWSPKDRAADQLTKAHSEVLNEGEDRFFAAIKSLEREMRVGTVNPLGRHRHDALRAVIPLTDRASLVIDLIGGFNESGGLHPDKPSFNDQHVWIDLLFPWDEAVALWPAAGGNEAQREETPKPAVTTLRSAGRPTLGEEIKSAYEALRKADEIDFSAPKNRLYEPIRAKVRERIGDPAASKGLQSEAIRSVIGPLFDTDKATRNTSP